MPKSPTAVEVPVKEIFSSNYLFDIPGYQRPYAWTEKEARELFDDLLSFFQSNPEPPEDDVKAQEELPTYFLGSIVLIKDKDKPNATVVDGQQRLTTLTILLAAIRARVDSTSDAEAIGTYIYEKGNKFSKLPDRYRLKLRPLDADFFCTYVQQPDGFKELITLNEQGSALDTDAKKFMRSNAKLFFDKLGELSPEDRLAFATFIANRCYLVAVSTADFRSAFRIFSVLNSRGLDLAPTDILKARILERIAEKAPKRVNDATQRWEAMEVDLGREGFLELFAHIRTILRKVKAKESLLDELTADIQKMAPVTFFDDVLSKSKDAFAPIVDADYQHGQFGSSVSKLLTWLNRLDFKDWIPPAIVFWNKHEKDGQKMDRFFSDLERLAYSMLIRREPDSSRIARFGEVIRQIEADADLWGEKSSLQLSPVEQWNTYRVLDGMFYVELKSGAARRAVLLRLDSLLATGEATYDHPIISVEHVFPQTPPAGSEWMEWFPTPEQRAYWTHRIGNLVLLAKSINSSARNFPFKRKKESYFVRRGVTTFALTVPVIGLDKWLPDTVTQRHKLLVAKLEDHWRLTNRKSAVDSILDSL